MRIFISHAATDRYFVKENLLGLLEALGFETWFAEDDIQTSEQWERSILSGLKSSSWFMLIMTSNAVQSEWVKDEVSWAFKNRPNRIIPILAEDCEPEDFHIRLPRIQHIDFRRDSKTPREQLIRKLVNSEYKPALEPLSEAEVFQRLITCPSKEILTVVRIQTIDGKPHGLLVVGNQNADKFFGLRENQSLTALGLTNILDRLALWMDPDALTSFAEDQRQLFEKLRQGFEVYATVPMQINCNHPYPHFRGQTFLPITLAYSQHRFEEDIPTEYTLVVYVHLNNITPH